MKRRRFANTDLHVSPLGLGTVKLGRDQGVKYPDAFRIPDDREARQLLHLARDLGINLLDTAPAYGHSEERLGRLLRGQRQDWVIATKVGEEFVDGQSHFDFSAEHTHRSVRRSLQRLHTDWLDIVLVHSSGEDEHILQHEGVLTALAELKQQGLIRAYGVSTKTVSGGLLAAQLTDAVMVTYHPGHEEERPVLDYCAEHQVAGLVKKAFASGHFAAEAPSAEASLEFVCAHPGVTSVVIGTINPDHLRSNVAAVRAATRSRPAPA